MFKYSQDEERFRSALRAFVSEYGKRDVHVFLPNLCIDCTDPEICSVPYSFWDKYRYSITTEVGATFTLIPNDIAA